MSTWFVSRHPGARDWATRHGLTVDRFVAHLHEERLQPGDRVIGTLPINLITELQRRGCTYLHLVLKIPPELRGKELSADQLDAYGAGLRAYRVEEDPLPGSLPS